MFLDQIGHPIKRFIEESLHALLLLINNMIKKFDRKMVIKKKKMQRLY